MPVFMACLCSGGALRTKFFGACRSKHQYHRKGGEFFISMMYEKIMKIEISRYYHANLAKPISQSQETRTRWFKTPGLLYHAGRCTMYIVYNLHLHMKHLLEIYIYCTFWTDETDVAERAKLVGPTRWGILCKKELCSSRKC